eukprot:COSAG01_NODE_2977_length_6764_cov_17.259865_4_plen_134_part_00
MCDARTSAHPTLCDTTVYCTVVSLERLSERICRALELKQARWYPPAALPIAAAQPPFARAGERYRRRGRGARRKLANDLLGHVFTWAGQATARIAASGGVCSQCAAAELGTAVSSSMDSMAVHLLSSRSAYSY